MESTLSLSLNDLSGEVGRFLGYGRGAPFGDAAWTKDQQAAIDSCVASGLRQFYFPPAVPPDVSSYDWSFLKPVYTTTLAQGNSVVTLPDDFGGFEGDITISTTVSQVTWPVMLVGEGQVRQRYSQLPAASGRPIVASIQPLKGTGISKGQRFQLFFFPLADATYTIQFAYYVLPDYLTQSLPFSYGGMAHAETVLESCLKIAEERLDDSSTVHALKFMERLQASISLDRRLKPQRLGYNRDNSDWRGWGERRDRHWLNLVQVNGIQY